MVKSNPSFENSLFAPKTTEPPKILSAFHVQSFPKFWSLEDPGKKC